MQRKMRVKIKKYNKKKYRNTLKLTINFILVLISHYVILNRTYMKIIIVF